MWTLCSIQEVSRSGSFPVLNHAFLLLHCVFPDLHYQDAVDNDGYENVLIKLNEYLKTALRANYTYEDHSKVALKFNYQVPEGGDVDVDLLLSPFWESQEHFFSDLANVSPPIKRLL